MFDTCSNKELGKFYLTKIYPVLERGANDCENNGPLYSNAFSVIDMTGVSSDPRVATLARNYHLPVISLNLDSFLPPETVAKTLFQITVDLKWHQIAIIHTSDEHSLQVLKLLGQASLNQPLCLKHVQSLPGLPETEGDLQTKPYLAAFIPILRNILTIVPENVPILIIGSGKSVHCLLEIMSDRKESISKRQWLLSSLPEPASLRPFINSSIEISALSTYPGSIKEFEEYWKYLNQFGINHSIPWLDELIQEKLKHEKPVPLESQLDSLWRTNQIMPLIQTVFILTHAFREAWASRCAEQSGLCPDLVKITRREFETNYLGDLRFEDRSLRELIKLRISRGRKTDDSIELALTKLLFNDPHDITYQHVIGFNSETGKSQLLNKSVPYKPSVCPLSGCDKCLKIRQSRIADTHSNLDVDLSASSRSIVRALDGSNLPITRDQCIAKCYKSDGPSSVNPFDTDESSRISDKSWTNKLEYLHISGGWYLTLVSLSALGIILIIACGFYFHLVFPVPAKSCLLEYMILFGITILFAINFTYLLPTSSVVCILRRIGMPTTYTMIFSALFAKVLNVRRLTALRDKGVDKLKPFIPSRLIVVACFLLCLQMILTLVWLFIIPPKPNYQSNTCSWPHTDAFIQTESIVSLVYIIVLVGLTLILSLVSWGNPHDYRGPRWIAVSCLLVASVWCIWALGISYSSSFRSQNNMATVCANIVSALILIICLYLRKMRLFMKVPSQVRKGRTPSQLGLHTSSLSGSSYGTLPKNSKFHLFNGHGSSYFRHSNPATKRAMVNPSFFLPWLYKGDQNEDAQSSCASTSGSIQVQAEDLYPMEVFEDADSLQPYHHYYSQH